MKKQITLKKIKAIYGDDLISIGDNELGHLLRLETPTYYTCGVYGWNADIYTIGDKAIITGCRGPKRTVDRNITKKYNELAREINDSDYQVKKEKLQLLIDEFLKNEKL